MILKMAFHILTLLWWMHYRSHLKKVSAHATCPIVVDSAMAEHHGRKSVMEQNCSPSDVQEAEKRMLVCVCFHLLIFCLDS